MASQTPRFGLNKLALSDPSSPIVFIDDNLDILDTKAALASDLEEETEARADGDTDAINTAKEYADGLVEEFSVTLTDAAASGALPPAGEELLAAVVQTFRNNLKLLLSSHVSVQTVTVPASAWGADGKATVAVPGMRQNMLQQDFFVTGESKTQAPIRAAAGLGNTDIIPGDGTMTLTAIGVIPTVDLSVVVMIFGREG
jgi:hypothetical protein